MNQLVVSNVDTRLKQKLESLAAAIISTQQRLNDHLMALLEPERLVTLWKLKSVLEKIQSLLGRTLNQPLLAVNDSMLDLVQSTEAILLDIDSRLNQFELENDPLVGDE